MQRLVSGPLIAHLRGVHRTTVNEAVRAGRYGPRVRRGRIEYVDLAAVERAEAIEFSEAQIARAIDGKPGRIITIEHEEAA